ncbi:MAG: hypothetical protein EPN82_01325 [Bacteroidetes bacterium]|nr:MAG: hypothetical protein EPN82_01325 [Bacteroidota bacterium]
MNRTSTIKFFAIVFAVALLFAAKILAADKENCTVLKIKTSANSWDSKNIIESSLSETLGVIDSDLDLSSKVLTVNINSEKTNCDNILKSIRKLGYDAELICNDAKDNNEADKSEKDKEKAQDCPG